MNLSLYNLCYIGSNFFKEKVMIIKDYEKFLVEQDLSKGTVKKYISDVIQFETWLMNNKDKTWRDYKYEYLRKYKISTINGKLISINKYLRWKGESDIEFKCYKIQKNSCFERIITKKEYFLLLDYALKKENFKLYCIMRVLALSGIRIGELKYFTVESLNRGIIDIVNKGKMRRIFLSYKLIELLKRYCEKEQIESGVIFRGRNEKAISSKTIWKNLKKLARDCNVQEQNVYPHMFRHLFAKEYLKISDNIMELADILGHSSLESTWRYVRSSKREKLIKLNMLDM